MNNKTLLTFLNLAAKHLEEERQTPDANQLRAKAIKLFYDLEDLGISISDLYAAYKLFNMGVDICEALIEMHERSQESQEYEK
jgi:hypothetical protein